MHVGIYDLAHFAASVGYVPPVPSPPRIPEPPRPPIQSGVDDSSVGVRGAEAKARTPIATAGGITQTGTSINSVGASDGGGDDAVAIGVDARIVGNGGVAIGYNTVAGGDAVVIGRNIDGGDNSVAIAAEDASGIRLGKFRLDNDLGQMGDTNNRPTTAHARITDTRENMIGSIDNDPENNRTSSVHARINHTQADIGNLRSEIGNLRSDIQRVDKGIAMAMAQEFIAVDRDRRARFGMTSSAYRGEFGIGASAGVRLNDRIQLHFSGAMDTGFDEKAMRAGFDIQFGGKTGMKPRPLWFPAFAGKTGEGQGKTGKGARNNGRRLDSLSEQGMTEGQRMTVNPA